jgi:DNA-binding GntR family transcriptional regulator
MEPLSPVRGPFSLNEQAYQAIKEAILNFKLEPGSPLVESELAKQLGMSKTPVRDALLQLEREGLVTKILFKGTYVTEISRQSIIDIFEIRTVLEGLAARLATPNLGDGDLRRLATIIEDHDQALRSGNHDRAAQFNKQFHELIITGSGNNQLKAFLSNLDDQLQRFRTLSIYQRGQSDKSAEEHGKVLAALQKRDAYQAEEMMRAHLHSVLDDLMIKDVAEVIQTIRQGKG